VASVEKSLTRLFVKEPIFPVMSTNPSLRLSVKSAATVVPVLVQYSLPEPKLAVKILNVTGVPSSIATTLGVI
jgi:hypothetical protein